MVDSWLYVGAFTHAEPHTPGARGAGLVTCAFDSRTGHVEPRHVFRDIRNAAYLALDERRGWLFSTSESIQVENAVHMFRRNPDGSLMARGSQPARGRATCHLCVLPDNGGVCAASYLQSCITAFPIDDGQLGPSYQFCDYHGTGPDAARQEASHAHQVVVAPNGRWLYVVDLGADRIWVHALDNGRVPPESPTGIPTPLGYGPRHLTFHPSRPRAYVLCELNGRVLTFDWDAATGSLRLLSDLSSCPHRAPERAAGAAIRVHPSGRALYISDREESELVLFRLDGDAQPILATRFSSGGTVPRDFAIHASGRWLIAGNQTSNNLAIFELDPATGLPSQERRRSVPLDSPGCVQFASADGMRS